MTDNPSRRRRKRKAKPVPRTNNYKWKTTILLRTAKGSKDLMKAQSLLGIQLSKDYAETD